MVDGTGSLRTHHGVGSTKRFRYAVVLSAIFLIIVSRMAVSFRQTVSIPRSLVVQKNSLRGGSEITGAPIPQFEKSSTKFPTSKATKFNVTFDPDSPPHPHAGARDENGEYGYVADVTQVRQWIVSRFEKDKHMKKIDTSTTSFRYLPFNDYSEMKSICNIQPKKGIEGEHGWDLLTNHIQVPEFVYEYDNTFIAQDETQELSAIEGDGKDSKTDIPPSKGKLLCVVYSYDGKKSHISAITETWGWRCDGFFAASTKTVLNRTSGVGFGGIDLPHLGKESYNNMWQKTRSILGYLSDHYLEDYDYFYVCGDDTYLVVENLRSYLGIVEAQTGFDKPLLIGGHVKLRGQLVLGGGAGYVLNKAGMKFFAEKALASCEPNALVSAEDRYISTCMKNIGGDLIDTADDQGRQRFMQLDANWIGRENPWETKSWLLPFYQVWESQGHGRRWGKNVTSTQTVSFHGLKRPEWIKRHHAVLYNACPPGTVLGDALSATSPSEDPSKETAMTTHNTRSGVDSVGLNKMEREVDTPPYNKYTPASSEDYIYQNSVAMGFDTKGWHETSLGCPLWKDANFTTPEIHSKLVAYREELKEFNRLVADFSSETKDLRTRIASEGYDICKSVDLKEGGVQEIFAGSQQLSFTPSGYVEPLLPPMRHPDFCDYGRKKLFDLRYLVHDFGAMCRKLLPTSRIVLFDLGASLNFANAQSPALYLMDLYHRFGFPFDHIYAYEITPTDPSEVVENVPMEYLPAYHWINVGVNASQGSRYNPFTTLLERYTVDDLIIFKLDIDTSEIELALARQLLSDDRLTGLIDQFYFEHHVHLAETARFWGQGMRGNVKESLDLFHDLRKKGVPAHFWV